MTCGSCGGEVADDASFCPGCGAMQGDEPAFVGTNETAAELVGAERSPAVAIALTAVVVAAALGLVAWLGGDTEAAAPSTTTTILERDTTTTTTDPTTTTERTRRSTTTVDGGGLEPGDVVTLDRWEPIEVLDRYRIVVVGRRTIRIVDPVAGVIKVASMPTSEYIEGLSVGETFVAVIGDVPVLFDHHGEVVLSGSRGEDPVVIGPDDTLWQLRFSSSSAIWGELDPETLEPTDRVVGTGLFVPGQLDPTIEWVPGGGTYDELGEGRLDTGFPLASSWTHVLTQRCDEVGACSTVLVDRASGQATPVPAEVSDRLVSDDLGSIFGSRRIGLAAGGRFVALADGSTNEISVLDLEDGAETLLPTFFGTEGVSLSADGRFLVAALGDTIRILEPETGWFASIDSFDDARYAAVVRAPEGQPLVPFDPAADDEVGSDDGQDEAAAPVAGSHQTR